MHTLEHSSKVFSAGDIRTGLTTTLPHKQKPKQKQKQKRVLHLAGTDRGGIWMAEQLRELRLRGYDVKSYITGRGQLSEKLESCGVSYDVARLEVAWSLQKIGDFVKNVYTLAWMLWKERFDVVHAHLFPTMIIARFASWIADVPVRIVMVPGPFYMEAESPPLLEMATAWMDTRIIPSCEFTRDLYLKIGVPESQLELVYYGPDEKNFDPRRLNRLACRDKLLQDLGLPDDTQLIGLVAYFYPILPQSDFVPAYLWNRAIKNHETVIEAATSVARRCPRAHFVMVGDGWGEEGVKYLESLKELVRSKGLENHISFLGARADVPELIASFDVSLQCSLNENLGGTIESLLMERPIVGTRVGGIVDSVLHEETGLLVDSNNPSELADAIVRLLTDRKLAERLGRTGRELMLSKFCLERTATDLDEVYKRCFAERDRLMIFNRPGYRFWVVPWRALTCLWWIGFSLTLFCKAEISGRLLSAKQQTSCRVLNSWYGLQNRLNVAGGAVTNAANTAVNTTTAAVTTATTAVTSAATTAVTSGATTVRQDQIAVSLLKDVVLNVIAAVNGCLQRQTQRIRRKSYLLVKRSIDIVVAVLFLVLLSPICLFLAPFYLLKEAPFCQRRTVLGKSNEKFCLLLLNTLPDSAPAPLRNLGHSLLFLPAWLNVLRGEMSLVGTRLRSPHLQIEDNCEYLKERWHMTPGLTGWCQLNMNLDQSEATLNGLDFLYIANSSLLLDLKILIKTIVRLALYADKRKELVSWIPE